MRPKKIITLSFLFFFVLLLFALISLSTGPVSLPFDELWKPFENAIWQLRFKRILIASLIGAGLSVSGAVFQVILKNPLADPHIIGVSSAAAFGATLAITLGLSFLWIPLFAFLGSLLTIAILLGAMRFSKRESSLQLLLTGVILSFLFSASVTLMLSLFSPFQGAAILFWLMGSLSSPHPSILLIAALSLVLVIFFIIYRQSYSLNLLLLGEEGAEILGISPKKVFSRLFISAALLTAISVSLGGAIGFVGLIIPHLVRLLSGSDHRLLIPLAAIGGAIFLVMSDTLIRLISSYEIPIGVITAIVGAPVFLMVLWRKT
jgi:iron complex transport system permease protein